MKMPSTQSSSIRHVVLLAVTSVAACGDGNTEPLAPPPDPPRATTITVSPATTALTALGATEQLTASVLDQDGRTMASASVTWSTSAASVATVSSTGLVTAANNGTATITATAGAVSGGATVTVAQEAFSPLELAPDTASLGEDARLISPDSLLIYRPGATVRLLPVATDANGNALQVGAKVAWESSDTAVATVDSTGLVMAVAVGATVVTATSGGSAVAADSDGRTHAAVAAHRSFARTTATMNVLVSGAAADRAALVALYEATNGPNWVNSDGWLTDAPVGEWHGVNVDAGGRVVVLGLGRNALTGPIPPELGNLSSLESLNLGGNALTGPVPPELGNLSSLVVLGLGESELTGPVPPELGNLSSLVSLVLGGNALTGPIPPELGNLSSLEYLFLYENELTGPIPPELGNLSSLKSLNLSVNALTGPIPPELGSLSSLHGLDLNGNALTGPIPPELGNLSSLVGLYLNGNAFTGPIPESFLGIRGLRRLYIGGNESLCVPNTAAFLAWLQSITWRDRESVVCGGSAAADRAALVPLYEATNGPNWNNSDGWLTDAPVSLRTEP